MTITPNRQGDTLTLALGGRLDTNTSPELDAALKTALDGVKLLILDLKDLVYLSSAGLRVILAAQKKMNRQGRLVIRHVCATIMEVFEITGFSDILTIE